MRKIKFAITFIFLLLLLYAHAQPELILNDNKKFYGHENDFLFFVDKDKKFYGADLNSKEFLETFKPATSKNFNFGLTSSAIWYKFTLANASGDKWLLQAGNPTVQEVTLYVPRVNGIYDSVSLSLEQKISERPWKNNTYLITLPFPDSSQQVFFLRITSYHAMNIPPLIGTEDSFFVRNHYQDVWQGAYLGFILVMVLYNFFVFLSVRDKSYLYYIFYMVCIGLVVSMHNAYPFDLLWPNMPKLNDYIDVLTSLSGVFAILFTMNFLHTRLNAPRIHIGLYVLMSLYILAGVFVIISKPLLGAQMEQITSLIGALFVFSSVIYIYRKGYAPAKFYLIAWSVLLAGIVFFVLGDAGVIDTRSMNIDGLQIGSAGEALLLSFALADRFNSYKREKEEMMQQQNAILENKVSERTHELSEANEELKSTLEHLKSTQEQLVQQEKLASLGQLTAGIAHEIKNPLNFVNNFSDLSKELIDEAVLAKNDKERSEILENLKSNLDKISKHSKRADSILKNMLEHSRASADEKRFTDVNQLCDEYLTLSYQSMRAGHRDFNCTLEKHLDPALPKANIVSQEISRVLLNLFKNALQAIYEKQKSEKDYQGKFILSTQTQNHSVVIRVKDNGPGISENIRQKIFEPFFTTKSSGEGTGLGLSISYDIVKAHGGEMKVESEEGEFTEFIISLPFN